MRNVLVILALVGCGCRAAQPVKWERGYKTPHVIGTRHGGTFVGYTIAFDFPLNAGDCDRVEVGDFVEDYGGHIYQGGGHPGATAYATFDGVSDDKTADRKMLEILPAFDKLMSDISAGNDIVKTGVQIQRAKKRENDAGKCSPESDAGLNINGTAYKCDPATKRWVFNAAAMEMVWKREAYLKDLAFALVSRVLTEEEMHEVESVGIQLYTRNMQSYNEQDLQNRFNAALLQQFKLREARAAVRGPHE